MSKLFDAYEPSPTYWKKVDAQGLEIGDYKATFRTYCEEVEALPLDRQEHTMESLAENGFVKLKNSGMSPFPKTIDATAPATLTGAEYVSDTSK